MQKRLLAIGIGIMVLLVGSVLTINKDNFTKDEVVTEAVEVKSGQIQAVDLISWDNFELPDGAVGSIGLEGDFDDDKDVILMLKLSTGEKKLSLGNAYDFSIHRSMDAAQPIYFFTGLVKEGKNLTHVFKYDGKDLVDKGSFYHVLDMFYYDGTRIFFYSDGQGEDSVVESDVTLEYAYDMVHMDTQVVTSKKALNVLHTYEEAYK